MHHSYEGLDRPGGFSRVRMLAPLRHRDFRLLWSGMCVSLMGDGIFLVAMAWQVYALSNAPTALSLVGIAMTVPTIMFLLIGGVVSGRLAPPPPEVPPHLPPGPPGAPVARPSLTRAPRPL